MRKEREQAKKEREEVEAKQAQEREGSEAKRSQEKAEIEAEIEELRACKPFCVSAREPVNKIV